MNGEEEKKRGLAKIAMGLLLAVAGIAGIFFGKTVKRRVLRISIFTISSICLASGAYLFVAGTTDLALGVVGQYKLDGPFIQTMTFPNPEYFKLSLEMTRVARDLRRLKYECPDKSKSFTIYRTMFGIFGIPSQSVMCADGFPLVVYDPSKGFVSEAK